MAYPYEVQTVLDLARSRFLADFFCSRSTHVEARKANQRVQNSLTRGITTNHSLLPFIPTNVDLPISSDIIDQDSPSTMAAPSSALPVMTEAEQSASRLKTLPNVLVWCTPDTHLGRAWAPASS